MDQREDKNPQPHNITTVEWKKAKIQIEKVNTPTEKMRPEIFLSKLNYAQNAGEINSNC